MGIYKPKKLNNDGSLEDIKIPLDCLDGSEDLNFAEIEISDTVSETATNVVTGKGVYNAINDAVSDKQDKITVDNKLDFSLIDNAPSTSEYSIAKDGDIYKLLKDGQQVGVSINIPKDLVVDSGKVEIIGGKTYIILVLNDTQKTEIKIEADKLIDIYNGDNTTIIVDENRQISVKSGVFQPKGDYALKKDIPTNYVTTNTEQTITGYKTFNAPANIGSTEQFTAKFKTSNGGSISFGKEAANSGTMLRFDQVDGTCRLRFRGSSTAGAIVWEQPETGASLYFDLGNGNNKNRIAMPNNKGGTIALTSDILKLTSGQLNAVNSGITKDLVTTLSEILNNINSEVLFKDVLYLNHKKHTLTNNKNELTNLAEADYIVFDSVGEHPFPQYSYTFSQSTSTDLYISSNTAVKNMLVLSISPTQTESLDIIGRVYYAKYLTNGSYENNVLLGTKTISIIPNEDEVYNINLDIVFSELKTQKLNMGNNDKFIFEYAVKSSTTNSITAILWSTQSIWSSVKFLNVNFKNVLLLNDVDNELSIASDNPIANKPVATEINRINKEINRVSSELGSKASAENLNSVINNFTEELNKKQKQLSKTQLSAVDSGITKELVTTFKSKTTTTVSGVVTDLKFTSDPQTQINNINSKLPVISIESGYLCIRTN